MDEVRSLEPEQYEEQREGMIRRLLVALMTPPGEEIRVPADQPPPSAGTGLPPLELPEEEPTDPAEREKLREQVRQRLRMLHEPYLMLENADIEMEPVERLIRQAREAFVGDELLDSAKAVNHASDLIWQLMQTHQAELKPLETTGPEAEPVEP